jgi:tetratricopeptide (TPR) repeat protein
MQDRSVRVFGLALATGYAVFILWLYVSQPQSMAEVTGGLSAGIGAYRIDQRAFADGLALFRLDQFEASRSAFERADPARQDPRTQFYIAYSYYRSGWGRVYNDDEAFSRGLEAIERAIALAPGRRLVVEDPENRIHNADELRAELAAGLRTEAEDLNPLRLFRERK